MNTNNFNTKDFYPTPKELLDKITAGIRWYEVDTILDPSAGKGDIIEYVMDKKERIYCSGKSDIDAIEIDPDLRSILTGKGFRVVHDNFLTFKTFKRYDLIIMNPPFSEGAAHLLKAIEMQKNGGSILCILNAETVKNPYTNERKVLAQKLQDLSASVEYIQGAFSHAEVPTDVEIAVIKITVPEKEQESEIFAALKKKHIAEVSDAEERNDLAEADVVKAIVRQYEMELEAGIQLIHEYKAMQPLIMDSVRDNKYRQTTIVSACRG